MITLAIDTSTPRGAVALLRDDKTASAGKSRPQSWGKLLAEEFFDRVLPEQNLFDTTAKILSANRLGAKDLGLLALGLGPGSFTGIRAGIAAAKGIVLPRKLPIKGASSFDALALTVLSKMPRDCPQMCVLGDARREEVYCAFYDREGRPVRECRIGTLKEIADESRNPIWFVSAEMERFKDDIAALFGKSAMICETPAYPSAAAVGQLALQRFYADDARGDQSLEPIYLRVPQYKTV